MVDSNKFNIRLEILKYIVEGLTLTTTAKRLNKSKQAISKHIKVLALEGKVRKIGYHYQITQRGRTSLALLSTQSNEIRYNNLAVKIRILKKSRKWNQERVNYLVKKKLPFKQINLNNNFQTQFNFQDYLIRTTSQSILILCPDFVAETPFKATKIFMESIFIVIRYVENLFNIKLEKDDYMNIEFIGEHFGLIENELAKLYHKEGNKLKVFDSEGNLRLIIDYSHRIHEFEATNKKYALEDSDKLQGFFRDLIEKEHYNLSDMKTIIDNFAKTQFEYAQAIKEHLAVLKQIKESLKKK